MPITDGRKWEGLAARGGGLYGEAGILPGLPAAQNPSPPTLGSPPHQVLMPYVGPLACCPHTGWLHGPWQLQKKQNPSGVKDDRL